MTKTIVTIGACATLLCAAGAFATTTPQQNCDYARVNAWRQYQYCVDAAIAKSAKGTSFDEYKAFAKCRHAYFAQWGKYQKTKSMATSTCIGTRFTDNGDQTVTDNLSGLVWEKKDNAGGIHDKDNFYSWSTGSPYTGNGTIFSTFLAGASGLNVTSFGGAQDWRLPTLAELQTILLDFACSGTGGSSKCLCGSSPCIEPTLDSANTQSDYYWSATGYVPNSSFARGVNFLYGFVQNDLKTYDLYVRAVRGGL